jgi:hypothetical protein
LARAVAEHRKTAAAVLDAARRALPGTAFTVLGRTPIRLATPTAYTSSIWVAEPGAPGEGRADVARQEGDAFWAWPFVEVLRHTGIRFEELRELSQHSIGQYRLPSATPQKISNTRADQLCALLADSGLRLDGWAERQPGIRSDPNQRPGAAAPGRW